jgi:hypothetical protein
LGKKKSLSKSKKNLNFNNSIFIFGKINFFLNKDPNKKVQILKKLGLLDDARNQEIFESSFADYINPKKKNKEWKLKQAAKGNRKIEDLFKKKK